MLRFSLSMSLDGFIAGPNPSEQHPLGEGGMQLHEWAFELAAWRAPHGKDGGEVNASTEVVQRGLANVGARIMGRKMFGGEPGPWPEHPWEGWWGDDPPFHTPVFVLTHHPRASLHKAGGTTFHFVDGIDAALAGALDAAHGGDVSLAGGASVAQQFLCAGLVDEFTVSVVPVLLGSGTSLFDAVGPGVSFAQVAAVQAPGVVHLTYSAVR
jgi:dihydrofolate reductase